MVAAAGGKPTGGMITTADPSGITLEEAKAAVERLRQLVRESAAEVLTDGTFLGKDAVGEEVRTKLDDEWVRPPSFAPEPTMMEEGYGNGDVSQGSLGDCWLLSAFSVLADHEALMDEVLVTKESNPEGVVGVRLFKNGKWRLILTDDSFPIKQNVYSYATALGSNYRGDWRQRDMRGKTRLAVPAFCSSKGRNELWPMVLEKTYAKYFGSFSAIVGGLVHTALVDLTGGSGFSVDLKSETSKTEIRSGALWKRIQEYHAAGYLMGCGSNSGSDSDVSSQGVVQGHAYSILNVVEASDQYGAHQLIRARNPWGSTEFKGKYSDADTRSWTKRLKSKVGYDPETADDDDGAFYIGFRDFVTQFRNLYVLRRFTSVAEDAAKGWHKYVNTGSWEVGTTSGGSTSHDTSHKNPHFYLKVSRPTKVFISLLQHEKEGSGERKNITISFSIMDNDAKRVQSVYGGELPFGWGPAVQSREATQEVTIDDPDKTYTLWVATWDPSMAGEYTLTVHSKHPLEDTDGAALKPFPADAPHN